MYALNNCCDLENSTDSCCFERKAQLSIFYTIMFTNQTKKNLFLDENKIVLAILDFICGTEGCLNGGFSSDYWCY